MMVVSLRGRAGRGSEVRVRRRVRRAALAAWLGLAACAPLVEMDPPSSDGPRLSRLEFVPGRSGEGCRVTLRLHVDSPHEEIVGALVGWALKHGRRVTRSGRAVLDVQPGAPGAATDDVSTTLSLGSAGT